MVGAMSRNVQGTSTAYFLRLLGVFALYLAAGKLGLSAPFTSGNVSPFWPASGIALASVLLWGHSIWPGIAAAAFLGEIFLIPGPAGKRRAGQLEGKGRCGRSQEKQAKKRAAQSSREFRHA